MRTLGVLKKKTFTGVAFSIPFTVGLATSPAGRHTVNSSPSNGNSANVTANGTTGKGVFSTAWLDIGNNLSDFNLQRDFDFTFKFKPTDVAFTDFCLFEINGSNTLIKATYSSSGRLGVKVKTTAASLLQTFYSANNVYAANVEGSYKYERRGNTFNVYFNGILVINFTLPSEFDKVDRNFRLGSEITFLSLQYHSQGEYDDFKFEIF